MVQVTTIPQPVRVGTARRVKVLTEWESHAALFELSTPFKGHTFVVASGLDNERAHEVMLFPSDAEGEDVPRNEIAALKGTDGWGDLFQTLGYLVTF